MKQYWTDDNSGKVAGLASDKVIPTWASQQSKPVSEKKSSKGETEKEVGKKE